MYACKSGFYFPVIVTGQPSDTRTGRGPNFESKRKMRTDSRSSRRPPSKTSQETLRDKNTTQTRQIIHLYRENVPFTHHLSFHPFVSTLPSLLSSCPHQVMIMMMPASSLTTSPSPPPSSPSTAYPPPNSPNNPTTRLPRPQADTSTTTTPTNLG